MEDYIDLFVGLFFIGDYLIQFFCAGRGRDGDVVYWLSRWQMKLMTLLLLSDGFKDWRDVVV